MIRIIPTIFSISKKFRCTEFNISEVGPYNPPQNEILKGVMNTATTLAIAVMQTDSAVFPLARDVIKFEMFPPGQAATTIIPRATLGRGLNSSTSRKVRKGRAINCDKNPTRTDFGALNTSRKSLMDNCSATPNIMNPRLRFIIRIFCLSNFKVAVSRASCWSHENSEKNKPTKKSDFTTFKRNGLITGMSFSFFKGHHNF
jgi:hypothetical protein